MVSKIKFTYFTADARVLSFRSAIIQLCSCFGLATVLKTKYMGKTSDGSSTGWAKSNATPVHTAVNVLYLRHFFMELAEILTMQQSYDSE